MREAHECAVVRRLCNISITLHHGGNCRFQCSIFVTLLCVEDFWQCYWGIFLCLPLEPFFDIRPRRTTFLLLTLKFTLFLQIHSYADQQERRTGASVCNHSHMLSSHLSLLDSKLCLLFFCIFSVISFLLLLFFWRTSSYSSSSLLPSWHHWIWAWRRRRQRRWCTRQSWWWWWCTR